MTRRCLRGYVTGRVQGVGFRHATLVEARRLGLQGWVRNTKHGSVELLICGDAAELEAMQEWLERGPPLARVDNVGLEPVAEPPPDGFERR